MSYTKVNWQNSPTATTPVGATRLGVMDQGIFDAHYPPLVSALPGSPTDGQIAYVSPAAFQTGIGPGTLLTPPFLVRYRAASSSIYKWEAIHGVIESQQSPTPDTVNTNAYTTASGGTGPTGIVIPFAGEYDVEISATLTGNSSATANFIAQLFLSFNVGATVAADADALTIPVGNNGTSLATGGSYHRRFRRTFTAAAQLLLPQAKGSTIATFTWINWRIAVYPILVG